MKTKGIRYEGMRAWTSGALALSLALAGCADDESVPDNAIVIGALLPYTGANNPTGFNNERAIALAAEQINEHGGIGGRPLHIIAKDTGLGLRRSVEDTRRLLEESGAQILLGPDQAETLSAIVPLISEYQVPTILASPNMPLYDAAVGNGLVRAVAPSTKTLGQALATLIAHDERKKVFVVRSDDPYSTRFTSTLVKGLIADGVEVVYTAGVDANDPELDAAAERAFYDEEVDAVALVLFPRAAVKFLSSWGGQKGRLWYLSPVLHSQEFLDNLPSGIELSMSGISPALPDDAQSFADSFAKRWDGDLPGPEAYFYYDAMTVVGLAMQSLLQATGDLDAYDFRKHLEAVSSASDGRSVGWRDIGTALALVRAGKAVNYVGASGAVDLRNGILQTGQSRVWTVQNRRFVEGDVLGGSEAMGAE